MKLPQLRKLVPLVLVACLSAVTLAQDDLVSDAQRLAMLKPQLTLKEAEKIIKGSRSEQMRFVRFSELRAIFDSTGGGVALLNNF